MTPRQALHAGAREALGVPAAVLGAGFIGYGSLAADAGYPVAASLTTTVPVVYVDCTDDLGFFVELYGRTERTESFFTMVRRSHEEWDRVTDPIRDRTGAPIDLTDG